MRGLTKTGCVVALIVAGVVVFLVLLAATGTPLPFRDDGHR